jgi:hypothetical protein
MNVFFRVYLVSGLAFILGTYVVLLSVWFVATLNGIYDGAYVVSVYTNALGENDVVLVLIFLFLPAMAWVFTRGLRSAIRSEASL